MAVIYNVREVIPRKLIAFLKYQVTPYLVGVNTISEYFRGKPVVDLNENKVLFHSGLRFVERLGEALFFGVVLSTYFGPVYGIALIVEGTGNYMTVLGYDSFNNRKKIV